MAIDEWMEVATVRHLIWKHFQVLTEKVNEETNRMKIIKVLTLLNNSEDLICIDEDAYKFLNESGIDKTILKREILEFAEAWVRVIEEIDVIVNALPYKNFDDIIESVHVCDTCGKPVLEGYCAGTGETGYFCSTECMLYSMPYSQYINEYCADASYYSTWDIKELI